MVALKKQVLYPSMLFKKIFASIDYGKILKENCIMAKRNFTLKLVQKQRCRI